MFEIKIKLSRIDFILLQLWPNSSICWQISVLNQHLLLLISSIIKKPCKFSQLLLFKHLFYFLTAIKNVLNKHRRDF